VHHGSRAHGARLNGHEKITVCQAVIADGQSGFPQGDDFRVGGGVGVSQIAIESAANNFAFMHDHGADRHLTYVERSLSRPQGLLHPQFVVFRISAVPHEQYCMRMAEPSTLAQMYRPISGVNCHQLSPAIEFAMDFVLLKFAFGHQRQVEIDMPVAGV
jgi:hypothetical protein